MSRKLDAALAVALGREIEWKRKVKTGGRRIKPTYTYYPCNSTDKFAQLFYAGTNAEVPRFSRDGNDMLKLDAEMDERKWRLRLSREGGVVVAEYWKKVSSDYDIVEYKAIQLNIVIAVALAAYYALTGKEWQEPVNT
jgi:hypothetical protein